MILFYFLSVLGLSQVITAPAAETGGGVGIVSGLSPDEVRENFGVPDQIQSEGAKEHWFYGGTELYFVDQRLLAWSGSMTELENRKRRKSMAPEKKTADEINKGWVNSWTPENKKAADEMLDELLR